MNTLRKLLIVDDDEDDLELMTDALKEIDNTLQYATANNGYEALNYLENYPPLPTCILLDLNMPRMNGFECLAELKKSSIYNNIPIVIVSTSNNTEQIDKAMSMGADFFFTKPTDFGVLKGQMNKMISMFI